MPARVVRPTSPTALTSYFSPTGIGHSSSTAHEIQDRLNPVATERQRRRPRRSSRQTRSSRIMSADDARRVPRMVRTRAGRCRVGERPQIAPACFHPPAISPLLVILQPLDRHPSCSDSVLGFCVRFVFDLAMVFVDSFHDLTSVTERTLSRIHLFTAAGRLRVTASASSRNHHVHIEWKRDRGVTVHWIESPSSYLEHIVPE